MKTIQSLTVIISFCMMAIHLNSVSAMISIKDYLAIALKDEAIIYQIEKMNGLKQKSLKSPLLKEVEVRLQVDQFDDLRQRYTARFVPNRWDEVKEEKIVYEIMFNSNETERLLMINQALRDRYLIVIDGYHNSRLLELNKLLLALYEDRAKVYKQNVSDIQFDPMDLINAENEIMKLQLDMINIQNKVTRVEDELRKYFPDDMDMRIDTKQMIGISEIETRLKALPQRVQENNIYLKHAQIELDLKNALYRLEKAKTKAFLSFLETSVDSSEIKHSENAFSVEFGVSIPMDNPKSLDIQRRELEQIEANRDLIHLKQDLIHNQDRYSRQLKRLISQYELLSKRKNTSITKASYEIYQGLEDVNPLILLKLKENMLKTEISMQTICFQVLEKYIELLDVLGMLSVKPLVNYLSLEMEMIQP
ncbi:MAG: hypothetical protein HQK77_12025 [Desulfobacterales bacterium]|nr:hypothetical protein [Desulfobacterales bacterium]